MSKPDNIADVSLTSHMIEAGAMQVHAHEGCSADYVAEQVWQAMRDAQPETSAKMLNAGVKVLSSYPGSLELQGDFEDIVSEIYRAMIAAQT